MLKYLTGIAIGICFVLFANARIKKQQQALSSIKLEQYQKADFHKVMVPWLALLAVLSVAGIIVGTLEDNVALIVIAIATLFESGAEYWYSTKAMVFYYNDERCIIDDRQVTYKNIRQCMASNRLPFAKGVVQLYNGEQKKVYHPAIEIINRHISK